MDQVKLVEFFRLVELALRLEEVGLKEAAGLTAKAARTVANEYEIPDGSCGPDKNADNVAKFEEVFGW